MVTLQEELAEIHAAQNDNWLALWEIAAKYEPEKTAVIAKSLNANDTKIGELLKRLGGNDEDTGSRDCDGP